MEFTTKEIEAMRSDLAINAFCSLVRLLPVRKNMAIPIIADALDLHPESVRRMMKTGAAKKNAPALVALAQKYDIRIYAYQIAPTTKVCINWLEHAYGLDKGNTVSKHTFRHWDRDMTRLKVRKDS
jgi:hypothetical protein